ncbi:hypothetical protein Q2K19_01930 [Micromonospora soli]|uniref:hypothetical protein n=1 Tax=Micromonospora sp. NBRC 110009 TaxID=3061627 RepID=UPI002670EBDB|nr:hypothetical protein [Micromonospora sp. NBRC 110009]WKT99301.1 hypothetical protein Q2K19_01930 [Micromonospora sp. NBRC 110009]
MSVLTVAAVVCVGLTACSADKSTPPVKVASGEVAGSGWTLVTFKDEAGELCLDLRDAAMKKSYSGACGSWADAEPRSSAYMDGSGPGTTEFAYGPLRKSVSSVEATAPGREPVVVTAQAMPAGTGVAKFFVIAFPDSASDWTYRAKNASGAVERLGP